MRSPRGSTHSLIAMIIPAKAIVRPRGICPETGDSLPLDEIVEGFIAARETGAIEITGDAGSGKSTALAHLAAVLSPGKLIVFLDDPAPKAIASAKEMRIVIYTANEPRPRTADVSIPLDSWGEDELIEYLLAAHHDRCQALMFRVRALPDQDLLDGNPELWRIVLDWMAGDESAFDIREILQSEFARWLTEPNQLLIARDLALSILQGMQDSPAALRADLASLGTDVRVLRLLRHKIVRRILATDRLLAALEKSDWSFFDKLPRGLIADIAKASHGSPTAMRSLDAMLSNSNPVRQSTAASILHATNTGWKPNEHRLPDLERAQLAGASWPGIKLRGARMAYADLARADLTGADLSRMIAMGCRFDGTHLQRADLRRASLQEARLSNANLEHARLDGAKLHGADLTFASLRDASLFRARLNRARIENADFTAADLSQSHLDDLPLRNALFERAAFSKASLNRCDMEGMCLERPGFHDADLSGALLTGTVFRLADFRGALLRGAGLADIDWEGADLRNADLSRSTFHLGSSRSGLVGSPIACEGSRTGFYTDDFEHQTYKSPEEIRKANLRGADLRGAKISGVDFYLVDLRDAKYTDKQAEHFRGCGAILFERAAS